MAFSKEPPPPWFLIAREALRGTSLETLSRRYNVSIGQIEAHLAKAIAIDPQTQVRKVRTAHEINSASVQARSDLISILLQAIEELSNSDKPRLAELPEFEKLLNSAGRLFAWPTVTTSRLVASIDSIPGYSSVAPNGAPTAAVNLSLIATSPEALAVVAKEESQEKGNGN